MKPIAVLSVRREPYYRHNAIESGLKRLGYEIVPAGVGTKSSRPRDHHDLLVLWNKKRGMEEEWANLWERQGGTVIVMENGYLQKVDKTMYALSTHGHNGSGWFPVSDEDRFSKLGFEMKPWGCSRGDETLVCGQRGIGSSLMASPLQWGEKHAAALRRSGRKVHLRVHPGNHAPKVPLIEDLRRARDVHVWSSAAGVMALVEGIPVQYHAPHWVGDSSGFPGLGYEPHAIGLHNMSHGQWSVAEIESGEPFARMRELDWGPKWV